MSLVKVKFPSPNRILNIWYKSYISDKDSMCNIEEDEALSLPLNYKIVWQIGQIPKIIKKEPIKLTKKEDMEEIKKIVKNPKEDIKKVVEEEKATVTKWDK